MSRIMKKLGFIFILVLIISFTVMFNPKNIYATTYKNESDTKGINFDNLSIGDKMCITQGVYTNRKDLFCIEKVDDIKYDNDGTAGYEVKKKIKLFYDTDGRKKIEINGEKYNYSEHQELGVALEQFFSIIAYNGNDTFKLPNEDGTGTITINDFDYRLNDIWRLRNCPRQQYLWYNLKLNETIYNNNASLLGYDYFNNDNLIMVSNTDPVKDVGQGYGTGNYMAGWSGDINGVWFMGSFPTSLHSKLIENASNATGEMYIITKEDSQNMVLAKAQYIKPVTIEFKKTDMNGKSLNKAKISVEKGSNVSSIKSNLATSINNNGNLGSVTVYVTDVNDNTFEIKVKETAVPGGYMEIGETTLEVTYAIETGDVISIDSNNETYINDSTNTKDVIIKNRPAVSLNFYKRDFGTTKLSGAKIEVTGYEDTVEKFIGRNDDKTLNISNAEGEFGTLIVYPSYANSYAKAKDGKATFKLKVKEITAPTGYIKMPGEVILTVTYDIETGEVISITDKDSADKDSIYITPTSNGKNVIVRNRPPVEIQFKKQNFNGGNLSGAKIKVYGHEDTVANFEGRTDNRELIDLDNDGDYTILKVYPADDSGTFELRIEEESAPSGHIGFTGEIILTVTYDIETGDVISVNSTNETYIPKIEKEDTDKTVVVKNRPVVKMNFNKQDFSGKNLKGAIISVIGYQDTVSRFVGRNTDKTLKDSNNDGIFDELTIYPADDSGTFKLKIEEILAPQGYTGFTGEIILTVTYDTATGNIISVDSDNETYISDITNENIDENTDKTVVIKNRPVLSNLKILKVDSLKESLTDEELAEEYSATEKRTIPGVTFILELENVDDISGYEIAAKEDEDNFPSLIYATTDSNGEINLNGIVLSPNKTEIKVKIIEYAVPDKTADGYYYKVDKTPIEMTITYANGAWTVNGGSVNGASISSDNAVISGSDASIKIKNQPYIALSGMVWQDGQTGNKDVQLPDGNKGEENGLAGVQVRLHNLETDERDYRPNTYTDENGAYSFIDIPKTKEGYRVIFNYDGVNYQETNSYNKRVYGQSAENYGKDSKIDLTPMNEYEYYREDENTTRGDFNYKFNTIIKNQAESPVSSDGSKIVTKLGYNYDSKKGYIVNIGMDGKNLAVEEQDGIDSKDFQIRARTDVCKNITTELDCGLVKKEIDLGALMQVDSTTLSINDKTTKYDHSKTLVENLDDLEIRKLEDTINNIEGKIMTTHLELSDYYYRIEHYLANNDKINNEDINDIYNNADKSKELEVYVTYRVELVNEIINNGVKINELAYYYDKNYTLETIGNRCDETTGKAIQGGDIVYEPIADAFKKIGKNGIKVSGFNGQAGNEALIETLYFTFKVNKVDTNSDGQVDSLPLDITNENGLNCANIVEITSYSTNNSLIDVDSAPGNLVDGRTQEDDSPQSNGLEIKLKTTEREIKGTVFEDTNKNGKLDGEDQKANNVIVQLIEIRSRESGGLGEFIWQQTESGSNKVSSINYKGNEIRNYEYGENVVGPGEYKFTGFIPGDYIIRYIYGDGSTYDFDSNGNIIKYNGQDYKSTKDPNYQSLVYNTAVYEERASVARDNESRRLEVMAYSTTIDAKIGQALNAFRKNMQNLTSEEKAALNSYYDSLDKNNIEVKFAYNASKGNAYAGNPVPATLSDDEIYNLLKYYVSYKTWMCAETSKIVVPIDTETNSIDTNSTEVGINYKDSKVTFENMNFGLALRPETKLVLEKHITGLKIEPQSESTVQPIVDAKVDISKILDNSNIEATGVAIIKSDRNNRGFWKVVTDTEELLQGAELEVEYTYVIKNAAEEKDYLSKILVNAYEGYQTNDDGTISNVKLDKTYPEYLLSLKYDTRGKTSEYGTYLGKYYYTGEHNEATDAEVLSRVETIEEALNNQLVFEEANGFTKLNKDSNEYKDKFSRIVYDAGGNLQPQDIETVVRNTSASKFLTTGSTDYSKTIRLRKLLSSTGSGELGINLPSYIAEIISYSNAAGRGDMYAEPENLSYVHSDDTRITLDSYLKKNTDGDVIDVKDNPTEGYVKANEHDEFWAESIIITKPTGEDKLTPMQIVIITTSSLALIGAGIVLIKKFVLKK